MAAPPGLMLAVRVTAVVVTVLVDPVDATGAEVVAETACVVRVPPVLEGVVVVVDGVVVPLELPVLLDEEPDDAAPDDDAPPPELDDEDAAGQPRRWSTTSCCLAAASVDSSTASVCWAELSWSLAELRLEAVWACWLAVPPASAVARVC